MLTHQILQEARKSAAEGEMRQQEGKPQSSDLPSLTTSWNATEGPIHMEALSLVARQCHGKTKKILDNQPMNIAEKLKYANEKIQVKRNHFFNNCNIFLEILI